MGEVRGHFAAVVIDAAEEGGVIAGQRLARARGDAAVGQAVILGIFIGHGQRGGFTQLCADRGRHADEVATIVLPVVVEFLIGGVDAGADGVGQRRAEVRRQRPATERVNAGIGAHAGAVIFGGLGYAVDHPAAAAPAKDQRVGALQHFDTLGVVERAVVLRIVTQAIDEEIGGGALPAQGDLVAVAFALAQHDARDEAQRLGQRIDALIVQLFAADHVHRLRHIDQRGAGLGCGRGLFGIVAVGTAIDDDRRRFRGIGGHFGHRGGRPAQGSQRAGAK